MSQNPYRIRVAFAPNSKAPGEPSYLRCRVLSSGSKTPVCLNLGFAVDPERWDRRRQRCTPNSFHGPRSVPAAVINREVDRYEQAVAALQERYASRGTVPTPEQLRKDLRAELGLDLPDAPGIGPAIREFVREQTSLQGWSLGTRRKFDQLQAAVRDFGRMTSFEVIDRRLLLDFVEYLRDGRDYANTTVAKYVGYLRWFLKWAEDRRYLTNPDWKYFRPKLKTPRQQVIYLTRDELMRVWDYRAPANHTYLDDVRDIFLFCCFTGLRYSDVIELRWADFEDGVLRITTRKTADTLRIEMNRWSNEILGRHLDEDYGEDRVFRKIPNQVMNRYLKQICREVGIDSPVRVTTYKGAERVDEAKEKWELIGTHAGRRTFVCSALSLGIPAQVVMKWTGHSDYKSMKPYIDVTDAAKASAMERFDEL